MIEIQVFTGSSNQFEKGELIRKLSNGLKRIANDKSFQFGLEYIVICTCALEVLDRFLDGNYDFPIDIEGIVEKIGIEVIYQPLNGEMGRMDSHAHKVVGRNLKRINRITNEKTSNILIDDESNRDEQRYALAHELAHYLIHQGEPMNSEYYVMPMLFKKMEEMVADIFAVFLLIPLPVFLNEFVTYIGEQSVPVKTSEWLKYLSIVAEVPYENVAIGYENIRYACGVLYGTVYEGLSVAVEDEELNDILQKQIEKMKCALTEEIVEKLFC